MTRVANRLTGNNDKRDREEYTKQLKGIEWVDRKGKNQTGITLDPIALHKLAKGVFIWNYMSTPGSDATKAEAELAFQEAESNSTDGINYYDFAYWCDVRELDIWKNAGTWAILGEPRGKTPAADANVKKMRRDLLLLLMMKGMKYELMADDARVMLDASMQKWASGKGTMMFNAGEAAAKENTHSLDQQVILHQLDKISDTNMAALKETMRTLIEQDKERGKKLWENAYAKIKENPNAYINLLTACLFLEYKNWLASGQVTRGKEEIKDECPQFAQHVESGYGTARSKAMCSMPSLFMTRSPST